MKEGEGSGSQGSQGSPGFAKMTPERVLERCSVLFFLQCQQLSAIRDTLENLGESDGPGTAISLIAHMKKEIQDQDAEIRALKA
jgi:hypothetical protein